LSSIIARCFPYLSLFSLDFIFHQFSLFVPICSYLHLYFLFDIVCHYFVLVCFLCVLLFSLFVLICTYLSLCPFFVLFSSLFVFIFQLPYFTSFLYLSLFVLIYTYIFLFVIVCHYFVFVCSLIVLLYYCFPCLSLFVLICHYLYFLCFLYSLFFTICSLCPYFTLIKFGRLKWVLWARWCLRNVLCKGLCTYVDFQKRILHWTVVRLGFGSSIHENELNLKIVVSNRS
jgi:hypothetical protein